MNRKNQEKQIAQQEQREANDAVRKALEILQVFENEINTLTSQLAQFIRENNQLEQQFCQATNNLEEIKYGNFQISVICFVLFNSTSFFLLIIFRRQLEQAQTDVEYLQKQLRDIDQQLRR